MTTALVLVDVWAMTDPIDASMQARLMQLARDEREISAALRGQSGFLAPVASAQLLVPDMPSQSRRSVASLAFIADAETTKAPSGAATCSPACKSDQGICVNGICLCHSPWTGESCEDAEAVDDDVPFEKDAQQISPEVGEALKRKVALPFAVSIWSTLLVFTFLCTALCPQVCDCGRRSSSGADKEMDYDTQFEKAETQFDIVEAWTFDSRKQYEREGQNESDRRQWFEDNVGPKLKQIKWPHFHGRR